MASSDQIEILKKNIGNNWLRIDGPLIYLDTEGDLWIDVHQFRALAAEQSLKTLTPQECLHKLTSAVGLYRGDFLSGFYLKDSLGFDEWQFLEQESLRADYASALRQLVMVLEKQEDLATAIKYGRRWLALDPLEEAVHRRLMMMYTAAGNRTLALRQYEACREILEKELGEAPDEQTEEVVRLIRAHSTIGHRISRIEDHPSNLPVNPMPFIDRETELARLIEILISKEISIICLTGAGGTGKTRPAVEAAVRLLDRFEHGVFFVDLLRARTAAQVIPAIARALDLREPVGHGTGLLSIVKGYLRNRRILLVLDNFEHVCPASSRIAELVSTSPGLKVLVTSRERLHIKDELELQIPPLDVPRVEDVRDSRLLMEVDSVRLFAKRAAAANPEFSLTDQNAAVIAEICRRLDGLPLAIELAASRLNVLSCMELMGMLANGPEFLREYSTTRPLRHQTLCSAIDWSYNLLDEKEKQLFTDISVFCGGCGFRAVERVCGLRALSREPDILDTLASLVDKNLIKQEIVEGDSRFSMLEMIGERARTRLGDCAEAEEVRNSHAGYYLSLALQAETELYGPDQLRWMDRLERENGNLHAALSWFLQQQHFGEALQLAACQALRRVAAGEKAVGTEENEAKSEAAFREYERSHPEEWSKGQVMSFEQAIAFAQKLSEA